ncbi:MAG: metallophosphoesterase [Bacteroidota bacterium]
MLDRLGEIIPLPTGSRYVIPDLHGCINTFRVLWDTIKPGKSDQVFLLGDYVNKGPDNLGVLVYLSQLLDQGHQLYLVLGNHDQMVLDYLRTGSDTLEAKLIEINGPDFLTGQIDQLSTFKPLFDLFVPYFESGDFILVHAGFDFKLTYPFADLDSMLNIRDFQYDHKQASGKTIIHGHFPHPLSTVEQAINSRSKIIPLDNGCVYKNRAGQGQLLCLNLDTFKLWVQPNIESL